MGGGVSMEEVVLGAEKSVQLVCFASSERELENGYCIRKVTCTTIQKLERVESRTCCGTGKAVTTASALISPYAAAPCAKDHRH